MTMLKKATNRMAFAKVGIYGRAGSGKTFTATQIAIGLVKAYSLKKPVGMFDTEPAASFIKPYFDEAGIEFLVYDESRALKDLMAFMDEAEKECSVIIIDSISHVWRDAQKSYLDKVNQKRKEKRQPPLFSLEFQHWRPIKDYWAQFTDRFLSCKCHVILCGRAGGVYEYQKNDSTGKMELITVGDRMATEKELGYEPSLLIEMVSERDGGRIINKALVEKDRSNKLNGAEIDMPTFKSFSKHFDFLNIGGEHFDSMDRRNSQDAFTGEDGSSGWDAEKRQREIWVEELKGLFIKHGVGGTGKDETAKRLSYLEQVFGTMSMTAIEEMKSTQIADGYSALKDMLEGNQSMG